MWTRNILGMMLMEVSRCEVLRKYYLLALIKLTVANTSKAW
jgi:hypothetical protein